MRNNSTVIVLTFLLCLLFSPVKAQIEFIAPDDVDGLLNLMANPQGHLFDANQNRFQLRVKCDDPNNNLSGNYPFELGVNPDLGDPIFQVGNTGSNQFNLNCSGTGSNFSQNINLTPGGQEIVKMATELGDPFNLPVSLNFIGQNDPGFQALGFEVSMTSTTDGGDDPAPTKPTQLKNGVTQVNNLNFGTYNINDIENTDLKVTYELKIDKATYDLFVAGLQEDETIEDSLKELSEQLGVKVNMRNLRKLARDQVRAAGRGLRGEEREAAQEEARTTGVTQLVDTIVGKLPPLPSTQTTDPEERERLRTIRQAKKNNLLRGLEIEVGEITDTTENDVELKCIDFCITLPIELCAADEDGNTLIIVAGKRFRLRALNPGETITANVPVKVVGFFKKFLGKINKKGKGNGKIDIPITITNPAE